jgi:exopolysaccharide biosynthesis polyprenyl glycosylphosphotransferase
VRDGRQVAPTRVRPQWRHQYALGLRLLDVTAAVAAAAATWLVRFADATGSREPYLWGLVLFPMLYVLCATLGRAYEERYVGDGAEEFRRIVQAAVWLAAGLSSVAFGLGLPIPRGYMVVALPLALAASLIGRSVARTGLTSARGRGRCRHRVLLVGTERSVAEMVRQMRRDPNAGYTIVGTCLDRSSATTVEGVPVVGNSGTVIAALWATGADTVAVTAWSILSQRQVRRLSWQLEGSDIDVLVAPAITDIAGPRIHIRPVAGLPLLHVEQPEFTGARRIVKGSFDRLAAALALLLLLPLLVCIGVAIRLTSSGPALFRQRRVGRGNSEFTIYKFRTMRADAEQRLADVAAANGSADGLLFKMKHDPRVTPIGAVLRRYSADELPQLINVVIGDMSLVGPRPPLPSEVARYEDDVQRRLLVKPGVTGLWQVSGRSDLAWEEAVRLDLDYVENWSLPLDLAILWRTGAAVLASRGAY